MKEQCTSCCHIDVCKIRSDMWDFIAKHSHNLRNVKTNDSEVIGVDLLHVASLACLQHKAKSK